MTKDNAPDWLATSEDEDKPDWLADAEDSHKGDELSFDEEYEALSSAGNDPDGETAKEPPKSEYKSSSSWGSKKGSGKKPCKERKPYKEEVSYRDETIETLTPAKLERLRRRGMNVSMYQLNQRATSSGALRDRMIKKGLPDFIIEETLAELERIGLIDDDNYAREFIREKRKYQKRGDFRIGMELQRKGFSREEVSEYLEEEPEEETLSEEDRAFELARERVRRSRGVDRQKRMNRLVGLLSRNGFMENVFGIAKQVIDEDEAEEAAGN